jgi:hypothetical protein
LCITEWNKKTFLAFPNWIEHMAFVLPPVALYTGEIGTGVAVGASVLILEHIIKTIRYFPSALEVSGGTFWRSFMVAIGAGSVLSAQELTRAGALIRRGSLYSICRRVDWFDGQEEKIKLDIQLGSLFRFGLNMGLTLAAFRWRNVQESYL